MSIYFLIELFHLTALPLIFHLELYKRISVDSKEICPQFKSFHFIGWDKDSQVNYYWFICLWLFKGYLCYETITSQNVSSEAQIKNFFIL